MNALILAAGLGTRLCEYTKDKPKALVQVAGKTMLEHQIRNLARAGFDHIIVNVHHYGDQIIDFLDQNSNFGLDIKVSDERGLLLDTGGGIRKAFHMLPSEPLLVHNVDIFSDTDLTALYNEHVRTGASATLSTAHRDTSRYLCFNQEDRLCGWINTKTGETRSPHPGFIPDNYGRYAFQGIHILSPSILPYLDKVSCESFSITDFYVTNSAALDIRRCATSASRWVDAGKPQALQTAAEIITGI